MKRNENGIAVPENDIPLPWRSVRGFVHDANDKCAAATVDPDYVSHVANFHERIAEIVRQLAEWNDQDDDTIDILPIVTDAATLWKEYQEESEK